MRRAVERETCTEKCPKNLLDILPPQGGDCTFRTPATTAIIGAMVLSFWFQKHIYNNHFEQVQTQLSRQPFAYPTLNIKRKPDSIFGYEYEDFEVLDYQHHAGIKAPVAV